MFKAIKRLIVQFCNMLGLFMESGEDLAYATKSLTTIAKDSATGLEKEMRLERHADYLKLEAQLKAAGLTDQSESTQTQETPAQTQTH